MLGAEVLQYALAAVNLSVNPTHGSPTVGSIASDCLLEGPAGQALVELLNGSNRVLALFARNIMPIV